MNPTSATNIAAMAEGQIVSGSESVLIQRVVTDSRVVKPGDLFVALKGPQFDAHAFVSDVTSRGASAIMVDQEVVSTATVIRVDNTLTGLQRLAANYRETLKCRVVAITGSNGKTSTKDFAAAVFGSEQSVIKTQGNLNNHIGLPLSILNIDDSHNVAVLELGMNHAGEIAPLAAIARPDAAIVTNIGTAHIEFLKTQDAIAVEKSELAKAINENGVVILNANDRYTPELRKQCRGRVVTAGIDAGDIIATELSAEPDGTIFKISFESESIQAFLPIPGRHMVANAMLAVAAGLTSGISLKSAVNALAKCEPTAGRLEIKEIGRVQFIDDTYNANPDSMLAALITLNDVANTGRRIAVLGAMGELGDFAEAGHRNVGASAAKSVDLLITVGETANWIADEAEKSASAQVMRAADTAQAAAALLSLLRAGDSVLVKGSRSARMEQVINEVAVSLQLSSLKS